MNHSLVSLSRRAFSLMELIVVIAIIAIIAGFTVPQAGQILKGSTLTQASSILEDQIRLAREYAVTKNSKVEVRFYQYADPEMPGEATATPSTWNYRAMQVFQVLNVTQVSGGVATTVEAVLPMPGAKVEMLPQGVIMNPLPNYPPLPASSPIAPITPIQGINEPTLLQLPRGVGSNYNYVAFRFMPDGSTNLGQTANATAPPPWFMTLNNLNDRGYLQGLTPYNYFCLQIDPVTGAVRIYRPQAG